MNKKILSAALCISLIAFSSCSKIIKEIKVEEKTHTIGFAYSGKTEYAYVERYKSIKEEFSSHDSDTLIILDAKGNDQRQHEQIELFIQKNVDYLIIDPIYEGDWETSLSRLEYVKIPYIFVGNTVKISSEVNLYSIMPNYSKEVEMSFDVLDEQIRRLGNASKKTDVCIVRDYSDATSNKERTFSIMDEISKRNNWNLSSLRSSVDSAEGIPAQVFEDNVSFYIFFAMSDKIADELIKGIWAAGGIPGSQSLVVCYDASPDVRRFHQSGELAVSVSSDTNVGLKLYEIIRKMELMESVHEKNYMESMVSFSEE